MISLSRFGSRRKGFFLAVCLPFLIVNICRANGYEMLVNQDGFRLESQAGIQDNHVTYYAPALSRFHILKGDGDDHDDSLVVRFEYVPSDSAANE